MLDVMELKKFQICPSFTLCPWNLLKPPKNAWYLGIYKVIVVNKSAYRKLKQ